MQAFAADLVLAQCLRALSGGGVEAHQLAMGLLTQWIELQKPLRGANRRLPILRNSQACQHVDAEVMQPRALHQQPVVEAGVRQMQPV